MRSELILIWQEALKHEAYRLFFCFLFFCFCFFESGRATMASRTATLGSGRLKSKGFRGRNFMAVSVGRTWSWRLRVALKLIAKRQYKSRVWRAADELWRNRSTDIFCGERGYYDCSTKVAQLEWPGRLLRLDHVLRFGYPERGNVREGFWLFLLKESTVKKRTDLSPMKHFNYNFTRTRATMCSHKGSSEWF